MIVTDACFDPKSKAVQEVRQGAVNGANWGDASNWLSDKPLDQWYGVITTNDWVTTLDLLFNDLMGAIPAELGNLSERRSRLTPQR